jgi:enterobactin synthetase component D
MRLEPIGRLRILPEFVACCSARLVPAHHRMYFGAGRECAARAMAQLGAGVTEVGRGPGGEPLWPPGFTGSITHKDDYISAAVARTSDASSIGIDTERIVDSDTADRIARLVLLPQEGSLGGDALPAPLRVSLLFSIKESVFKCLYPLVRRRFYYDALAVTALDLHARVFHAQLVKQQGDWLVGHPLSGRFDIENERVHTGIWLPPA